MIEAHGLAKSFRGTRAVSGFSVSVPAGTTMCLLGPNGAGKTTVVRMLTTLLRPDDGWARVAGHDVVAQSGAVRRAIGLSGQYVSLDDCLSGRANLAMIGSLSRLPRRRVKERTAELLAMFELEHAAGRAVRTYSGGMRRRLDLAASLMARPEVLFLDEPTTGLDPRSRLALWDVIRDLVAEGTTLLLTTQYLEEADQLADRICVIDAGRVTAEGTGAELKASVGTAHLVLTFPAGADLALARQVLARHACAAPRTAGQARVEVPVAPRSGLVTEVVRDLDAAGLSVDEITLRQPSLDDVFHAITGLSRHAPAPQDSPAVPGGPADGEGAAELARAGGRAA